MTEARIIPSTLNESSLMRNAASINTYIQDFELNLHLLMALKCMGYTIS